METEHIEDIHVAKRSRIKIILVTLGVVLAWTVLTSLVAFWYVMSLSEAPEEFPINTPVVIEAGTEVRDIARQLADAHVVNSADLLYFVIVFSHNPGDIKASSYVFDEPMSVFEVAKRLTEGDFDTDLVRFTHFEGERVELLAERADEILPNFDEERFLAAATPLEGTLFPETYFIPNTFTDEELLALLTDTYSEKLAPLREKIDEHTLTEEEIIILASIIEREANTLESKRMVAGIFLNRLEIGMALQADATIEYAMDVPLNELKEGQLAEELRKIDSPYNTYLYPGLPPTPIGNPGLESIAAVLDPTVSNYMYYLTGTDGEFYYATTYDQHLNNIERYLR